MRAQSGGARRAEGKDQARQVKTGHAKTSCSRGSVSTASSPIVAVCGVRCRLTCNAHSCVNGHAHIAAARVVCGVWCELCVSHHQQ